jgi:hypothetical protein
MTRTFAAAGFSVDPSNGNYYLADADLTFVGGPERRRQRV